MLGGDSILTLDMTDTCSQWAECRATWNKRQPGLLSEVAAIEAPLPFALPGFDSENGGEFINWHRLACRRDRGEHLKVASTRSRPYHKNDNARVELKNWTPARHARPGRRWSGRKAPL
jgi:hypothetical protein